MEIDKIIDQLNTPIGFLSALVGIVSACVTVFKFFKKKLIKLREPIDVKSYLHSLDIRKKYKIAIVDDELNDFPIEYMKKLGYTVSTYESISLADVDRLLSFDIIFLDVKGVVKEDFETGGAKLLNLIKRTKSNIVVIAVSSGKYQLSLNGFFENSDDVLNKPIEESEIERIINDLVKNNIDIDVMANKLYEMVVCSESKQQKLINKSLIKYFSGDMNFDSLREIIHKNTNHIYSESISSLAKMILGRINYDS
ncbi:response regulator transcription factor [Grimontia hollisae]|uniref:Response regulatory domain-containing protein n=1 Tax=Grimontia hollisae CIP 101886 TaxID=675812 RepID=D0I3G8_GRIHO|nr:response regulator transcription factor [Grimontia hollisae]EEY73989.1 hypothetical protein VHA_000281 [Grimontia hollisae CIP 101886]STO47408.1 Uncharacterised protein [Grimontia hollisae]